jgi:cysteine-rich repeat protein
MGTCVPLDPDTGDGDGDGDPAETSDDTNTGDGDPGDGDGDTGDGDGDGDPLPNCGDTVIDYVDGEQCDDGNIADGDGCSANCAVEVGPNCGDGNLEAANGEECDDGNVQAGDGCSANCQFEPLGQTCGDDIVDQNEVCDDGNMTNGDSCNPTCNLGNATSLFAGGVGAPGLLDGVGAAARFGGVGNLAISNDKLWVSDGANNCIRQIDILTGAVTTIAGDGAGGNAGDLDAPVGLTARFGGPGAITTDGTTLWVADAANHKIKAINLTPPYAVTTVAGSGNQANVDGIGLAAAFFELRALTYYSGYVYLLDGTVAVLRSFDVQSGAVATIAGQPNNPGIVDGAGNQAQFLSPRYIASDNSGMLYIADTNGYHIRSYNVATAFVGTFAGNGMPGYADGVGANAAIHRPRGMTSDGTSIYFTEFNQQTIRQGVLATASITTLVGQHCNGAMNCPPAYAEGVGTQARLGSPFDVVFHYPSNSLFFFDGANNAVRRVQ